MLNDYQTYKEWQSDKEGLFVAMENIKPLPFFADYTPVELDELFHSMYDNRIVSKAFNDKTNIEVVVQLIMRFSSKWDELYTWFNLEHPFNASSVTILEETTTTLNKDNSEGENINMESAYNVDGFTNSDKTMTSNTNLGETDVTKTNKQTRESLQAMTIRRSMLEKEVFIDNVFKDVVTMLCLSIY